MFDLPRTALKDRGLVQAGGRQRTDSTRVLAAVRDLNRLELAGETLRATLEGLACAAPDWLAGAVPVREWAERYGPRIHSWHPPASTSKREEMALVYGRDGFALLEAVHAPDAPAWLRELPAVQVLRMIWVQNYHRTVTEAGTEVKRRGSTDLPPGRLRLASPYDTDARYGLKQGSWWTGYKIHISESCDDPDDQDSAAGGQALIPGADGPPPRLITGIATTDATVTDAEMTEPVHQMLAARDLLPAEHFLDSGYASAELIVGMKKNFGVTLVTPVLLNSSPQARAGARFDHTAFTIDWDKRQATCPRGDTSTWWSPATLRGTKGHRHQVRQGDMPPLPGTRPVHPLEDRRPDPLPATPRAARSPRPCPPSAGRRAVASQVRNPRGHRGNHPPGRRGHRDKTCPLPRPPEDPPGARLLRRCTQPHSPRCLVERPPARPHPRQPPCPPRPLPRRVRSCARTS